ncbi:unnamed protein product [Closterium sp. NIES-53]
MGLQRNLTAGEIVDQVVQIRRLFTEEVGPVTNLVFMVGHDARTAKHRTTKHHFARYRTEPHCTAQSDSRGDRGSGGSDSPALHRGSGPRHEPSGEIADQVVRIRRLFTEEVGPVTNLNNLTAGEICRLFTDAVGPVSSNLVFTVGVSCFVVGVSCFAVGVSCFAVLLSCCQPLLHPLGTHCSPARTTECTGALTFFLPLPAPTARLKGMGEPLHNLPAVLTACNTLLDPLGAHCSPARTTVSTCGLVPEMHEFCSHSDASLALSLHATTDEVCTAFFHWVSPVPSLSPMPPTPHPLLTCSHHCVHLWAGS